MAWVLSAACSRREQYARLFISSKERHHGVMGVTEAAAAAADVSCEDGIDSHARAMEYNSAT